MKLTISCTPIAALVAGSILSVLTPFNANAVAQAQLDPPYANCKEAHADGAYNIKRGDPGYRQKLDRDNDGIACEG